MVAMPGVLLSGGRLHEPRLEPILSDPVRATERHLALGFVLVRSCTLVEILIGLPYGATVSTQPTAYVALTCAVLAHGCWNHVVTRRRHHVPAGPAVGLDIVVAILALVALSVLLPPHVLLGTWAAWAPGYAVAATVGYAICVTPWRQVARTSLLLASVYMATMFLRSDAHVMSILANGSFYPMLGVGTNLVVARLRHLAQDTAEARERAVHEARRSAEAAREAALAAERAAAAARRADETATERELDRYRLHVHDISTILRLLGSDETPPSMVPALRRQALAESRRIRTLYLDGHAACRRSASPTGGWTLGDIVMAAMRGFDDLPLEPALDLGAHVVLEEGDALVLQRAVTTVLHNVRRHADAECVVIHADEVDDRWELTIRDDGVGFDPTCHDLGFGLGVQVLRELGLRGLDVDIESAPGCGTAVTVCGRTGVEVVAS